MRSSLVDTASVCVCVCVSVTDEACCDSVHMPSVFAKTACQSDSHVERAVPGRTAWIRWTRDSRLVTRERVPLDSRKKHHLAELNAG